MQFLLHLSQHLSYSKAIFCRVQLQNFNCYKDSLPNWDRALLHKKNVSTHKVRSSYTAAMVYSVLKIYAIDPSIPGLSSPPLSLPRLSSILPNSILITPDFCVYAPVSLPESFSFTYSALQCYTVTVSSSPEEHCNLQSPCDALMTNRPTYTCAVSIVLSETFCFQISKSASCH